GPDTGAGVKPSGGATSTHAPLPRPLPSLQGERNMCSYIIPRAGRPFDSGSTVVHLETSARSGKFRALSTALGKEPVEADSPAAVSSVGGELSLRESSACGRAQLAGELSLRESSGLGRTLRLPALRLPALGRAPQALL